MRKLSKREQTLLGLLGLVALLILYISRGGEARPATGGSPADRGADRGAGVAPIVETALLAEAIADYDPTGRDLFAYAQPPERPWDREERLRLERERQEMLRRRAEEARQRRAAQQKAKQEEPQRASPRPRPGPPKPALNYLGYLGPKENRIAVFEDGKDLLLARVGEVVQELYLVREINYEQVVVGYTQEEFRTQTTTLSMAKARR